MTISQPSPDRLIFQPKYKSIVSFQIVYGILIICFLSIAGASVVAGGLLFSFVLSKSLAASYLNISNDPSRVATIILGFIFITLFAAFYFYLAYLLLKHHITDSCTFDRVTSTSSDWYFGDLLIQQRNIFNQKRNIKIPLHTITDIRVQYLSWVYLTNFNVLLSTNLSAQPIYISNLVHNPFLFFTIKSIVARGSIVASSIKEIESIRGFLHLPPKPSYLVDESYDYLVPSLINFHDPKILKETSNTFIYLRRYKLLWYRETCNFNSELGMITIEYQYFTQKFVRRIAMDTIQSVIIKRELSTPIDSIGEIFHCSTTERYSAILVAKDSSLKRDRGYKGFYIPGNIFNGYGRVYTSKKLLDTKNFADRLNHYLSLADRDSSLKSTY